MGVTEQLDKDQLIDYILRINFVRIGDIARSDQYRPGQKENIPIGFHFLTRDRLTALEKHRSGRISCNNGIGRSNDPDDLEPSRLRSKAKKIHIFLQIQAQEGGLEVPTFAEDTRREPWLFRVLRIYPYHAICELAGTSGCWKSLTLGVQMWTYTRSEMRTMILTRLQL